LGACFLLLLLEDTIAAFDQLQQEGKILSWGVSNFDVPDLEAVYKIVGDGRIACNQVLYHLKERAIVARSLIITINS
jgi:diketogulonate reductase-like aldo/keto reductase